MQTGRHLYRDRTDDLVLEIEHLRASIGVLIPNILLFVVFCLIWTMVFGIALH